MLRIDNNLLQEVGLGGLPDTEKNSLLRHIYETLEMRVGIRLADQMTNEQLDEFERYFEAKDDAGAFKWLETNFPNYKEIVQEEFDKLKAEIAQSAPQILSSSTTSAQQPAQAPAPQQAVAPPQPQTVPPQPVAQPQQPPTADPYYQQPPAPAPQAAPQVPQPPAPYMDINAPQPPAPAPQPPQFTPAQPAPINPVYNNPASPQPPQFNPASIQPPATPGTSQQPPYPDQQPPAGPATS
jgi:hypothetical protein